MHKAINGAAIELARADITREKTDVIVNAANSGLAGGGGVDGAIHAAGGPQILRECAAIIGRIGRLPSGQAVITGGGLLAARHVIHTVGPVWRGGMAGEAAILASAYRNSLALAVENGAESVAFPSISTGIYGYPVEKAAPVALESIAEFLRQHGGPALVRFALFDGATLSAYSAALERLKP
ncbi:MAG: O-acetyl-ADP-ribose deacetylase [Elusimicrobia bacterium]|nr:O-acetyl-ADP-ribose deacetylase [Elusimicrobiota bacterium]